jgi:hypothetical protein
LRKEVTEEFKLNKKDEKKVQKLQSQIEFHAIRAAMSILLTFLIPLILSLVTQSTGQFYPHCNLSGSVTLTQSSIPLMAFQWTNIFGAGNVVTNISSVSNFNYLVFNNWGPTSWTAVVYDIRQRTLVTSVQNISIPSSFYGYTPSFTFPTHKLNYTDQYWLGLITEQQFSYPGFGFIGWYGNNNAWTYTGTYDNIGILDGATSTEGGNLVSRIDCLNWIIEGTMQGYFCLNTSVTFFNISTEDGNLPIPCCDNPNEQCYPHAHCSSVANTYPPVPNPSPTSDSSTSSYWGYAEYDGQIYISSELWLTTPHLKNCPQTRQDMDCADLEYADSTIPGATSMCVDVRCLDPDSGTLVTGCYFGCCGNDCGIIL